MTALTKLMSGRDEVVETSVSGIPCLAKVTSFLRVPAWKGSAHNCPSDLDYYGYTEIEFELYDRKGYRAGWLESKLDLDQDLIEKVEEDICKTN